MSDLASILQPYGVPTDAETARTPLSEVDTETALRSAIEASPDWSEEARRLDLASGLPFYVQLADIRVASGKSQPALSLYECALLQANEAGVLCEIGSLYTARCRVPDPPVAERDFGFLVIGAGDDMLTSCSMVRNSDDIDGPEFPDKRSLLALAVRAFGRGYITTSEPWAAGQPPTLEDQWHELLALEGLRATFIALDEGQALRAVIAAYDTWVDDADTFFENADDLVAPMKSRFQGATWFLKGRKRGAPQVEELADRITNEVRKSVVAELAKLHDRLDPILPKLLDIEARSGMTWDTIRTAAALSPVGRDAAIHDLQLLLGETWTELTSETRDDLVDSRPIGQMCRKWETGWRGAAIGLATAVERELLTTMQALKARAPDSLRSDPRTLGETVRWMKQIKAHVPGDLPVLLKRPGIDVLYELNDARKTIAHPEPVTEETVTNLERIILRNALNSKPLLQLVVEAR